MSSSSALSPQQSNETARSAQAAADPARNPSYPPRVHFGEHKALQDRLASWEEKLAATGKKLATLGASTRRTSYERLYHQMQGARDQMAECVRRMPLEAGILYEEDRERLAGAEAALARTLQRWDAAAG